MLRAMEPLEGIPIMRARGDHGPEIRLLSGPGKIGRAFGLTVADSGRDLTRGPLGIAAGATVLEEKVAVSPRIGISRARDLPYRFYISDSAAVSEPTAGRA